MDSVLTNLRRIIHKHRYRYQLAQRIGIIFGEESDKYLVLMAVIDAVVETHDKGHRDNGDKLKSHEFAMFSIALVYCGIRDLSILLAILLHDMIEDYPEIWSPWLVGDRYGQKVKKIVLSVTKPDKRRYSSLEEFDIATFKLVRQGGKEGVLVKCIDRLHNMLTLYGSHQKMLAKTLQTIQYVLPMSAEHKFLTFELVAAVTEQMSRLKIK
jgi:(p)ppGpp synthase/HD superfamily hydrolase